MTKKKCPADSSAPTCRACRRTATIVVTRQPGKTLEWTISCSKVLGGCGRWFDCMEATARRSGLV